MDRNIESYAKIYKNFLSTDECKKAVEELNQVTNYETHSYRLPTGQEISFDTDFSYTYHDISIRAFIMLDLWHKIREYIESLELTWFHSWQGYTDIRFHKYTAGTKMNEHCDHIHSIFDGNIKGVPILSLLGSLNNDYEGGEFVLFQNKVIQLDPGDLLIFPSNFLYPHRVNPITKGTRYSYISWVY